MNEEVLSVLKVKHIVVDRMVFERTGFKSAEPESIRISTEIEPLEGSYRVILSVKVEREFLAEVHMSAFVEIGEDVEHKDKILTKNTLAILFPFVRSQMTLLTSQPETIPIILPVMDINRLVEEMEKEKSD